MFLNCRNFISTVFKDIDLQVLLREDIFLISTSLEYSHAVKLSKFPLLCEYIATVVNHKQLSVYIPLDNVNLRRDEHMYLQEQSSYGCWMHCLFALLGESLHTHFAWRSWIYCTLISFIDCVDGTEEALEPCVLNLASSILVNEIYEDVQRYQQNTSNERIQFACSNSKMVVSHREMTRFLGDYESNLIKSGLSKIKAHRLFSSLGHPSGEGLHDDIYIGAKSIGATDLKNAKDLILEFENRLCSVMIVCCP